MSPKLNGLQAPSSPSANMGWILIGRLIEGLATMTLLALLARHGGSSVTGAYNGARAIGLLALAGAEFGLSRYTIQTYARRPEDYQKLFGVLLSIRTVIYLIAGAILLAVSEKVGNDGTSSVIVPAFFLLGFWFVSIAELFLDTIRAGENSRIPIVIGVGQRLLYVVAGGYGILARRGLDWLAACFVIANASYLVVCVLLVVRSRGRFQWTTSRARVKPILTGISPFIIVTILGALNTRVDVFIIYRFSSESQVGAYGATVYLVEAILLFAYAVLSAALPNLSRLYHGAEEAFRDGATATMKLLFLVSSAFLVAVTTGATDLLNFLYGAEFRDYAPLLNIIGLAAVALSLNAFMTVLFQAADRPRRACALMAALLGIHLVLSIILVPQYGAYGALLALLISEGVILLIQIALGARFLRGRRLLVGLIKGVLACGGMLAVLICLDSLHVLVRFVAGFSVLCVLVIGMRFFDHPEIKWLRTTAGATLSSDNRDSST